MALKTIVIATIRPWNIKRFKEWKPPRGYRKVLISRKEDLTFDRLRKLKPAYVFFPHWSWIIPGEIFNNFKCILFHMTDLPFGRGGSPMQNLIVRGIYRTKVSAIKLEAGLDTGAIYMKKPLDLSTGSAQELFEKLSETCFSMIKEIVAKNPTPKAQKGTPVIFKRRTPEESAIPTNLSARQLYDFIRMVDAEGYPRAFGPWGEGRIEFSNAILADDSVKATATFKPKT